MAVKRQFSLRSALALVAGFAIYLALGQKFGFGRAIFCLLAFLLGASSSLFVAAAWFAMKEGNWRNAVAASVISLLILVGAVLIARIVFHVPLPVPSAFGSVELHD